MATPSSGIANASVAPSPPEVRPSESPVVVMVHVAGAVRSPGVYRLEAGDRVHDAVELAGGPTPDALLDGLNLAALTVDGQRIYVPVVGEIIERSPTRWAFPPHSTYTVD